MPNSPELLAKLYESKDPDAMVLKHMVAEGADLSKPHKPDFAFEAAKEADAQTIAETLDSLGYEVRMYEPDDENPNYQVVGERTMVLDLAVLNRLTDQFEALARTNNATYDGWGAEIVE
jgi:regulator of ribonuclease activity B